MLSRISKTVVAAFFIKAMLMLPTWAMDPVDNPGRSSIKMVYPVGAKFHGTYEIIDLPSANDIGGYVHIEGSEKATALSVAFKFNTHSSFVKTFNHIITDYPNRNPEDPIFVGQRIAQYCLLGNHTDPFNLFLKAQLNDLIEYYEHFQLGDENPVDLYVRFCAKPETNEYELLLQGRKSNLCVEDWWKFSYTHSLSFLLRKVAQERRENELPTWNLSLKKTTGKDLPDDWAVWNEKGCSEPIFIQTQEGELTGEGVCFGVYYPIDLFEFIGKTVTFTADIKSDNPGPYVEFWTNKDIMSSLHQGNGVWENKSVSYVVQDEPHRLYIGTTYPATFTMKNLTLKIHEGPEGERPHKIGRLENKKQRPTALEERVEEDKQGAMQTNTQVGETQRVGDIVSNFGGPAKFLNQKKKQPTDK